NRATGAEDTLPFKRVSRLLWALPSPPLVGSITLDADLYFFARDGSGIRQVWRLPRSGLDPVQQVTFQLSDVRDYALSPNRAQIAMTVGNQLLLAAFADPTKTRTLVSLNEGFPAQPDWSPDGREIAFVNGWNVYTVAVDTDPGP